MRLMFVITRGDVLGGAQSYVRDLALRFAAGGDQILVVTGARGAMTEALSAGAIDVVQASGLLRQIHPIHDVRSVVALARLMREFRPDLVTTHSSKAGVVGRVAARLAGVPCVHTAHGWSFNPAEPVPVRLLYRALERTTAPFAARFICVSEHGRALGIAAGIAPERLVTIHNGIPDIAAELRVSPGQPGPIRLACVARFQPPKDHRTLLLAVKDVPEIHLDLIGDGPSENEIRALVHELGVRDRVHFLGARRDVPELLAQAQAFALCSRSEGFPLSTLEAMRQGLPVVVSNAGGAPEAVRDGETGYVVADNSVATWVDRLTRLARDPGLRSRMGDRGRALYEERFAFEQMYALTARLYREIAQQAVERERSVMETV